MYTKIEIAIKMINMPKHPMANNLLIWFMEYLMNSDIMDSHLGINCKELKSYLSLKRKKPTKDITMLNNPKIPSQFVFELILKTYSISNIVIFSLCGLYPISLEVTTG